MSITKDLLETVAKLAALQARTEDIRKAQDRIESKLDDLINRVSRVETNYENLRENLRNQILADIKGELVQAQIIFNQKKDLLKEIN